MLRLPRPPIPAGDERGFSLIELLVAMLSSGVIVVVLFSILQVTARQTTLVTDKVQANRVGRGTMTKVLDELHSACLASGYTGYSPVQAESTPTTLIFYNAYSKQAAIPSASESAAEGAYKHELTFKEAANGDGTLVDKSFPSTSVSAWPKITFSATATSRLLGEDLSKTGSTQIFQYYKYNKTASATSANTAVGTLEQITLAENEKLSSTTAAEVASVIVSFNATSSDYLKEKLNRPISLSSQVTFAFTAPNSESTIEDSPCE